MATSPGLTSLLLVVFYKEYLANARSCLQSPITEYSSGSVLFDIDSLEKYSRLEAPSCRDSVRCFYVETEIMFPAKPTLSFQHPGIERTGEGGGLEEGIAAPYGHVSQCCWKSHAASIALKVCD